MRSLLLRACSLGIIPGIAVLGACSAGAAMTPGSGILGSKHDFRASAGERACTVCHVPARPGLGRTAWEENGGRSYSWPGTRYTASGTRLPVVTTGTGGPSGLCLSCHDGTMATGDQSLRDSMLGSKGSAMAFGGTLEGNHPISIPYPAGGMPNIYNGVVTGMEVGGDRYVSNPTALGIVLYRDNGDGTVSRVRGGVTGGNTGMECSSCHDVHNGPTVQDEHLIRGKLSGSGPEYICLKCHML